MGGGRRAAGATITQGRRQGEGASAYADLTGPLLKAGQRWVRHHAGRGGAAQDSEGRGASGSFWLNQLSRVLLKIGQHRQTQKSEKVRPSRKDQGSPVELENLSLFLPQGSGSSWFLRDEWVTGWATWKGRHTHCPEPVSHTGA